MALIPTLVSFAPSTQIKSADVNANFLAIQTAFNTTAVLTDVAKTIAASHTFSVSQSFGAGIVVTAGGITVTGASTITGALNVTGTSTLAALLATTGTFSGAVSVTATTATYQFRVCGASGGDHLRIIALAAGNGVSIDSTDSAESTTSGRNITIVNPLVLSNGLTSTTGVFSAAVNFNVAASTVAATLNGSDILKWDATNGVQFGGITAAQFSKASISTNGAIVGQFDNDATAGNTRFLLYDVTAGALVRVSRGAVDSGGAGFRVLRVPN